MLLELQHGQTDGSWNASGICLIPDFTDIRTIQSGRKYVMLKQKQEPHK